MPPTSTWQTGPYYPRGFSPGYQVGPSPSPGGSTTTPPPTPDLTALRGRLYELSVHLSEVTVVRGLWLGRIVGNLPWPEVLEEVTLKCYSRAPNSRTIYRLVESITKESFLSHISETLPDESSTYTRTPLVWERSESTTAQGIVVEYRWIYPPNITITVEVHSRHFPLYEREYPGLSTTMIGGQVQLLLDIGGWNDSLLSLDPEVLDVYGGDGQLAVMDQYAWRSIARLVESGVSHLRVVTVEGLRRDVERCGVSRCARLLEGVQNELVRVGLRPLVGEDPTREVVGGVRSRSLHFGEMVFTDHWYYTTGVGNYHRLCEILAGCKWGHPSVELQEMGEVVRRGGSWTAILFLLFPDLQSHHWVITRRGGGTTVTSYVPRRARLRGITVTITHDPDW